MILDASWSIVDSRSKELRGPQLHPTRAANAGGKHGSFVSLLGCRRWQRTPQLIAGGVFSSGATWH